ncbi:MAG TPA: hypothetical protein VFM05_03415, partial [Candidatus Saccharimonadales bacterium]|nr:hypothetical protein [Candidatus Saccharimonadales bacterium]
CTVQTRRSVTTFGRGMAGLHSVACLLQERSLRGSPGTWLRISGTGHDSLCLLAFRVTILRPTCCRRAWTHAAREVERER